MAGESQWKKADGNIWFATDANRSYFQACLGSVLNYGTQNCGSASLQVVPANSNRKSVLIRNFSSYTMWFGASGMTINQGAQVSVNDSVYIKGDTSAIYACGSADNLTVRYWEVQ
jgi:hypothetical protein